jgi:TatD DNase family protein
LTPLPGLIDTHCHLDAAEFEPDRDAVAAAARAAGVERIVVPAVERGNFPAVERMQAVYPGCSHALGIHPMYVDRAVEGDLDVLRSRLERDGAVAVGEIGLDFFVEGHDAQRQERWFAAQLELAREFGLPVLLHIRRAQDIVLKHLRRIRVPGGIAHAFSGSRVQAEAFLRLGFRLGFGGTMTYERATRVRELAATLPIEAIVLETDAPDIPPSFARGRRNDPANLLPIAHTLAALRGIAPEEAAAATRRNALDVLPRLADAAAS